MKYLVYAFYPNLGVPVRVTDYTSKRDMYEYVSALRMTDTAYVIQDVRDKNHPFTIEVDYGDIGEEKMIQMLTEWAERKEE